MAVTVKWFGALPPDGGEYVFGQLPDLPVEPPAGTVRWRIRSRPKGPPVMFVKTAVGAAQYFIVKKDGKLIAGPMLAENRRGKTV